MPSAHPTQQHAPTRCPAVQRRLRPRSSAPPISATATCTVCLRMGSRTRLIREPPVQSYTRCQTSGSSSAQPGYDTAHTTSCVTTGRPPASTGRQSTAHARGTEHECPHHTTTPAPTSSKCPHCGVMPTRRALPVGLPVMGRRQRHRPRGGSAMVVAGVRALVGAALALLGRAALMGVNRLGQTTGSKEIPNALNGHEENNR